MRASKILCLPLALILILLTLTTACAPANPAGIITQPPPNADAITQSILTSLSNNDYVGFSKDFDQYLKSVLNEKTFNQLNTQFKTTIGDLTSLLFYSFSTQGEDTTVLYVAHYTKEPAGVSVSMVFRQVKGTYYVHGFNMDSPNLRGQPLDLAMIRSYADGKTENILVSLNGNNYDGFVGDLDNAMKKAESKSTFDQLYSLMKSTVGEYTSKDFQAVTTQDYITTVRYLAKFSNEPAGVWVTISFDAARQVAGLYFTSPRLAATPRNSR